MTKLEQLLILHISSIKSEVDAVMHHKSNPGGQQVGMTSVYGGCNPSSLKKISRELKAALDEVPDCINCNENGLCIVDNCAHNQLNSPYLHKCHWCKGTRKFSVS